ncbi:FlgO family outer membrane protein [Leptospirillum ferriphilum]|uniref:FlgO family outer membrane protein n=1 Tax=Leptospirillum ferriphilum TaxID=178606 RepID=UPI0006B2012A|nr:FlgO family outer membrane protein [Leptospirillum ferriphilum]
MEKRKPKNGRHPAGWTTLTAGALAVLAGCQTTPAVPYVPPKETGVTFPTEPSETLGSLVDRMGKHLEDILDRTSGGEIGLYVAIVKYTDTGGVAHSFGRVLALKLGEKLAKTGRYHVIDPGRIHQALRQEALNQGIVDTRSVLRAGRRAGADRVVLGNYTDLGPQIELNTRVIRVSDGFVLGQFSEAVDRGSAIMNLIHVGP